MTSPTNDAQKRILLIDDNVDAASMMQALLTAFGFTVETANSGAQGLALAQIFLPQVIFLDLGMPVMNGYEVATALRKLPALADVFLLALTGWNDQGTRAAVIAAGFDRHLVKPPDFEQIRAILAQHFEARATV
ncbi:Transcriptional activator protein CzcR [Massilia sp. Bi118]|uniref:response regulator n=1 Tax=Massilia sp. Bi118 TaxID=2822346 RepID=UPI001D25C400|nr:response regulator [Massilia sp. Bi118]CAH0178766.1 Transcriptional activator protein CzcR [Massilia sp. Bi118]